MFDRINVRASTSPGFGKDSILELLGELIGDIAIVQKPTIAKLEYLSMNKVLMVNELMNLTKQEYRDIEQYLLSVGAFKNNYTKRSRAGSQGKEDYDISKLSVLLTYNNLQDYLDGGIPIEEYFDRTQTNQVKDRFIPFKFGGVIVTLHFPPLAISNLIWWDSKSILSAVNGGIFHFVLERIRFLASNCFSHSVQ